MENISINIREGEKINMSKRIYISADYSLSDGDRNVIEVLQAWGNESLHKVDYIDTAEVISGSVSNDSDCRACDLKEEFNRQINASSSVIFVIGDKTSARTAGSNCERTSKQWYECSCTPYKQNVKGIQQCKVMNTVRSVGNVGPINSYSYLKHEFLQAVKQEKNIIIFYNSLNKQTSWLPSYMKDYKELAVPFWKLDAFGNKKGDYAHLKEALGY